MPVQPSFFDIAATRQFLELLLAEKAIRKERIQVAIVGMRVDSANTLRRRAFERFLSAYDLPVLTYLRDTQLYVQVAANGMTLFDFPGSRVEKDIEQWRPIIGGPARTKDGDRTHRLWR